MIATSITFTRINFANETPTCNASIDKRRSSSASLRPSSVLIRDIDCSRRATESRQHARIFMYRPVPPPLSLSLSLSLSRSSSPRETANRKMGRGQNDAMAREKGEEDRRYGDIRRGGSLVASPIYAVNPIISRNKRARNASLALFRAERFASPRQIVKSNVSDPITNRLASAWFSIASMANWSHFCGMETVVVT